MTSITSTGPKRGDLTSAVGTLRPGVAARINGYFPPSPGFIPNPVVKDLFSLARAEAGWIHLAAPKNAVSLSQLILLPSSSHPKPVEFPPALGNEKPKGLVTNLACFYHQDWLVLGYFHLSESEILSGLVDKKTL